LLITVRIDIERRTLGRRRFAPAFRVLYTDELDRCLLNGLCVVIEDNIGELDHITVLIRVGDRLLEFLHLELPIFRIYGDVELRADLVAVGEDVVEPVIAVHPVEADLELEFGDVGKQIVEANLFFGRQFSAVKGGVDRFSHD